jgi:hypothetical protein
LVVPEAFDAHTTAALSTRPLFHGRGEITELAFLDERMRRIGESPCGAFVLHPYGRYCNEEVLGETPGRLDDVGHPIDETGWWSQFSLGGATCWHFAVHHAWRWAAAAPGAGFSETAEFLRVFQSEELQPPPWEQALWRLHDATAQAVNVGMVPLVAYSGEKDRQIQAARAMERALTAEGLALTHIIGIDAGHQYTPAAKQDINQRIDAIVGRGRDPLPTRVRFVTHSLLPPQPVNLDVWSSTGTARGCLRLDTASSPPPTSPRCPQMERALPVRSPGPTVELTAWLHPAQPRIEAGAPPAERRSGTGKPPTTNCASAGLQGPTTTPSTTRFSARPTGSMLNDARNGHQRWSARSGGWQFGGDVREGGAT